MGSCQGSGVPRTHVKTVGNARTHRVRFEVRHDEVVFLGDDLLAWLVLALGGALFVGNVVAIVRPPDGPREEGALEQAPVARSLAMAAVGLIGAVWALATLISG